MSTLAKGCPSGLSPSTAAGEGVLQDPSAFVTEHDGRKALDVMVRGARCGGCLAKIEGAVRALPGVTEARLNLSTGRLHAEWIGGLASRRVIEAIAASGYSAAAFDPSQGSDAGERAEKRLLVALAVSGIATAGVMFLSEPVWFGSDMPADTRALLRWISTIIAIPATAWCGLPFYVSAATSISRRRLNMDVPISLAVILATALSLYETATGGVHAYFDASVMLIFFLLIGRYLDARLRRRAYAAANALAALQATSVTRLDARRRAEAVRATDVRPGDLLLIASGERLAVDAEVVEGASDVDARMVTGEMEPVSIYAGQALFAGTVNLTAPIVVRATAPAARSLMADIARMLEAGEQKKSAYRRIADKAAEAYVPWVHATAAAGLVGWLIAGAALPQAAYIAVSVLIITCPCAMALAAPLVQVVAAGRLFRDGVFLASGDALERIATVDHVVFDKTGTLTLGEPVLREGQALDHLQEAAMLGRASHHPFSRAIVRAAGPGPVARDIVETAGQGVRGEIDGREARLGGAQFVGATSRESSQLWFAFAGEAPVAFEFDDALRPDAAEAVARLAAMGIDSELLSGDSKPRVQHAAGQAGITRWAASATPQEKAHRLEQLEALGRRVLMVGDGLNDAGALALAHASLAPGGAVDVSRMAADCVFSGDSLNAVVRIVSVARSARRRIRENFAIAAAYNILAVPIALAGLVTPLVAAAAMSASSAIVTLNALRLSGVVGKGNGR